jgi:hypothetical protein
MVTSPKLSTSILSMPFGPRELFTVSAIMRAAIMLVCWASLPLERLEPSFNTRTGIPDAGDDKSNNLLMRLNEKQHYNINFSLRCTQLNMLQGTIPFSIGPAEKEICRLYSYNC